MRKSLGRSVLLLSFASILFLGGCYWPEKFTASLNIEKDKSFVFTYNGILAFAPVVAEIAKSGKSALDDEKKIRGISEDLKKDTHFKSVVYVGKGRFQVKYEKAGMIDHPIQIFGDFLPLITIAPSGEGVTVKGMSVSGKEQKELTEIGLGFDGKLKILSALKIVEQNATSVPPLGLGAYEWNLNWDMKGAPLLKTSGEPVSKILSPLFVLSALGVILSVSVVLMIVKKRRSNIE